MKPRALMPVIIGILVIVIVLFLIGFLGEDIDLAAAKEEHSQAVAKLELKLRSSNISRDRLTGEIKSLTHEIGVLAGEWMISGAETEKLRAKIPVIRKPTGNFVELNKCQLKFNEVWNGYVYRGKLIGRLDLDILRSRGMLDKYNSRFAAEETRYREAVVDIENLRKVIDENKTYIEALERKKSKLFVFAFGPTAGTNGFGFGFTAGVNIGKVLGW